MSFDPWPAREADTTAFIDAFARVVQLIADDRLAEAEAVLSVIAEVGTRGTRILRAPRILEMPEIPTVARTANMPVKRIQAAIFARDNYTCRYCNRRTIHTAILDAVSRIYPETFRSHSNWKMGETDFAYWRCSISLEHIRPLTRSGGNEIKNLITACWRCNELKGNSLLCEVGWEISPVSERSWDGLTSFLKGLAKKVQPPRNHFEQWVRAIEQPAAI